ncbi:MAG TPA: PAS domain S-box protein [Leptolyngbyaceae cyanobacterium M33_DOE_097]|uniref:histidine kinase n=1 Tax=Oscillatoriales cyanobacterium SpSt-418 TaxID=2282169 RepID=A0A7C3PKP1_9CYAN|nr:PAS domain S-box protein [Leptolyngbyaceae cyanobacterium M33_DOE_097]
MITPFLSDFSFFGNPLLKLVQDLRYVKDPEGRFILVNQQFERVFGQSKEAFIGKTDYDFFPAEIADGFREKDHLVMDGETIEFEESVPHVNDLLHDYISIKFPLRNAAGEVYAMCGISTEITDRKQAEAALRDSEARFRGVVESNMVGIFFWDASGCITDGNDMAVQMLGYSREELRSRQVRWQDITPPEFHEIDARMQAQLLMEGGCAPFEKAYIRKDGVHVPILIGSALVPGYRDRGVAYFIDITERIQALAALRESEDQLRLALQSATLGTWDFNLITNELKWDDQCKAMFGLSPTAEIDYSRFLAGLHSDDRDRIHAAVQAALCPNSGGEIDIQYRTIGIEDGVERWIAAKGKAFFNQSDEATRFIGTVLNITEQKRAEAEREQLLARERLYVNQLQGLTHAALAINSALSVEQVLQVINSQAASIIGTHQAVTSMTIAQDWEQAITSIYLSEKYVQWWDYDEKPDGTGIYACVCHLNRPMRLTQAELEAHPRWQNFGKAGDQHPPMRGWLAAPLMGRDGHNIGLIQLSDKYEGDFTEADEAILVQLAQMASVAVENARLYEAEQQARTVAEEAREEAQSANRIKDEFLAVLSHELRSPLNPILGWSKLLLDKKLDQAKTDQALSTIARNAKLQAELIEDLLDVSRILRGKLSLNVAPVDLRLTIQAALETVRLSAEAKSIQIHTTLEANVGFISGDSSRLQQIVWNLLSNAIKFTPAEGQVEVKLEQVEGHCSLASSRPDGSARENGDSGLHLSQNSVQNLGASHTSTSAPATSPHPYAQITVRDTGKGIHPDFLPHVFDYFRQEDGATTRKFGGLGLGLAIVHHLVELHGGTVQAESLGDGQGATFTVLLPLAQGLTQPYVESQSPEPTLDLHGLQVLVVDDDNDTRDFVAFLLEQAGASVSMAASADEALLTLGQFQPDVLLSDIGMPGTDGYMLLRQIRSRAPQEGSQIPAIALTAYAAEIDYQQAMAAGFQRHIPKPIEPQVLIQAIRVVHHSASTNTLKTSGGIDKI